MADIECLFLLKASIAPARLHPRQPADHANPIGLSYLEVNLRRWPTPSRSTTKNIDLADSTPALISYLQRFEVQPLETQDYSSVNMQIRN